MKRLLIGLLGLCCLWNPTPQARADSVIERLLTAHEQIESLSCSIRREIDRQEGRMRMLSRVFYQRPDKLHVENLSPIQRRYVADGERMFYYIDGDPKGFSRPIPDLPSDWLISLRSIPGTAMEHLLRLRGGKESPLEPTEEFPERVRVEGEHAYAVLSLDSEGRLVRIEFFSTPDQHVQTAQYDYLRFKDLAPGLAIPRLHRAVLNMGGAESHETVRIENLHVNKPISAHLFVAAPFFENVVFEDDFSKIYD